MKFTASLQQHSLLYPMLPSIHSCMSHQFEQTGVPSRCIQDHQAAFQLLSVQAPQLDPGPLAALGGSPVPVRFFAPDLVRLSLQAAMPAGVSDAAAGSQPLPTHGWPKKRRGKLPRAPVSGGATVPSAYRWPRRAQRSSTIVGLTCPNFTQR